MQPRNTTIYYGSGDVDSSGVVDESDYLAIQVGVQNDMGDVNGDGKTGILDLTYLIDYVIRGGGPLPIPMQTGDLNEDGVIDQADIDFLNFYMTGFGPASQPLELADVNGDSEIDILDVEYLTNYVNNGGPAPIPIPTGDFNNDGFVD